MAPSIKDSPTHSNITVFPGEVSVSPHSSFRQSHLIWTDLSWVSLTETLYQPVQKLSNKHRPVTPTFLHWILPTLFQALFFGPRLSIYQSPKDPLSSVRTLWPTLFITDHPRQCPLLLWFTLKGKGTHFSGLLQMSSIERFLSPLGVRTHHPELKKQEPLPLRFIFYMCFCCWWFSETGSRSLCLSLSLSDYHEAGLELRDPPSSPLECWDYLVLGFIVCFVFVLFCYCFWLFWFWDR